MGLLEYMHTGVLTYNYGNIEGLLMNAKYFQCYDINNALWKEICKNVKVKFDIQPNHVKKERDAKKAEKQLETKTDESKPEEKQETETKEEMETKEDAEETE